MQAREYAIYNRDAEVAVHRQRYAVWVFSRRLFPAVPVDGSSNDENATSDAGTSAVRKQVISCRYDQRDMLHSGSHSESL